MATAFDLHTKVIARTALLALFALNVLMVPGIHGSLPLPAPGAIVFYQEITAYQEGRYRPADVPIIPVLPEIVAIAGVTLLWSRIARGTFFRRAWLAYLLASIGGTLSRLLVPWVAAQRWLPFTDIWLVPALVVSTIALHIMAARVETRYERTAG